MRVQTIHLANLCVDSKVVTDHGAMIWIVRVTERGPEQRLVLEQGGNCGHLPTTGDGLDIAACHACEIAAGLASPATGKERQADATRSLATPKQQVSRLEERR